MYLHPITPMSIVLGKHKYLVKTAPSIAEIEDSHPNSKIHFKRSTNLNTSPKALHLRKTSRLPIQALVGVGQHSSRAATLSSVAGARNHSDNSHSSITTNNNITSTRQLQRLPCAQK